MKKVLSVLCMAILAGGMIFTSCTKSFTITVKSNNDAWGTVSGGGTFNSGATTTLKATANEGYEFEKWNDGNTEPSRTITVTADETWTAYFKEQPAPPAGSTKVMFNNSTWEAANMSAVDKSSQGYLYVEFFKVANSEDNIYCDGYLETTPGEYTYQSSQGDIINYRDPNYTYYDATGILDEETHQPATYWGWNTNSSSFNEKITAVDLNALTMSGSWSADVFSIEDYVTYLADGTMPTMVPFSGTIDNMPWTWNTSKANVQKKGSKKIAQRVK